MAEPRPHNIANWIAEALPGTEIRPLRNAIAQVLQLKLSGVSTAQIDEYAEKFEAEVFRELGVIGDRSLGHGFKPGFVLEGDPGSAYVRPFGQEARDLLDRIRNLSPRNFELFCAKLLAGLGGTGTHVGGVHDGGVDFEATDIPLRNELPAFYKCQPMVIGQAKRYSPDNLVTVSEVRSFLGAAVIRSDERKKMHGLGLFSPVVFALWTTSDLNRPGLEFANKAGIWYLSGIALAQAAIAVAVEP